MIKIGICDDEQYILDKCNKFVDIYKQKRKCLIQTRTFKSGLALLDRYDCHYDIIFLDIQMNMIDGIQVAKEIRQRDKQVNLFFLTSLPQYSLEGYKVNAANYLLKPLKYNEFEQELDKVINRFDKDQLYIIVKNDNGKYKIFFNQILYVDTMGRHTIIHTENNEIVSYKSMKEHSRELENSGFLKIHESYLVNMYAIHNIEKFDVKLVNGEVLPLSKRRKPVCMKLWLEFLGEVI